MINLENLINNYLTNCATIKGLNPKTLKVLASGEISHLLSGENDQS